MSHYKNASYTAYYIGNDAAESSTCEVRFSGKGEIAISYESNHGYTVYKGEEKAPGHYVLECANPPGRASLHRFPDSLILEGYWEESDTKGMWRIGLGEVSDDITGEDVDSEETPALEAELSKLFANTAPEPDDEVDEEEEDDWGTVPRRYCFPLRLDWDVRLRLPNDMSRKEGKRLAAFVHSLAYCR